MCITSTARRRSLTLQVLPSHLLATSAAASFKGTTTAATDVSTGTFLHLLSTSTKPEPKGPEPSSSAKAPAKKPLKKSKKGSSPGAHLLPHHDGLVVQHHYHDHATDPVVDPSLIKHKAKGGVIVPFPVKLHDMLDRIEEDGLGSVVSWQPHGRCFVVHKPKEFVDHVMPHYFKQTKMASFQRQLNLYGFNRLTGGLDKGGYYHEMFLRGKVSLAYDIHRMRVKGTGVRLPTNPDNEPNFYALPPVTKTDVAAAPIAYKSDSPPVFPPALPPLPPPNVSSSDAKALGIDVLTQRRADLLRESHDHSRKIARAKQSREQEQQRRRMAHGGQSDVVFFEGLPFHYLDPSALPSRSESNRPRAPRPQPAPAKTLPDPFAQPPPAPAESRPAVHHSTSSIVSESESEGGDRDAFLPSFSASKMDWDGPLSCPTLQAHMRRSSFRSFPRDGTAPSAELQVRPADEDIEGFFQGFDMPVDMYHDEIERMGDDDDTAFGYLLEQAITE